jgi:F-type H+-transporting ATPase subunit a
MTSLINRLSAISINKFGLFLCAVYTLSIFTAQANNQQNVIDTDTIEQQEYGEVHTDTHAHEEKFNTSHVIMEHIADGHDWHLWGHTSIHLPVILFTNKGVEFFSSANFDHGHAAYKGKYYTYQLDRSKPEKERVIAVDENGVELGNAGIIDFSITKNVASMLVSMVLLFLLFFAVAGNYKKRGVAAPKGIASFMEPLVIFVRDEVIKPNLGENYTRFTPYLMTVFFFIWINNVLGLVPFFPGGANVTGNIAVTFVLAFITFILTNINGTKTYWGHIFTPHVPMWLYPLMIPVEIIGIFTKPFSLMIRLFANITAGHILVLSLVCLIFIFKSYAIAGVSVPFVVFISLIELLVGFIQAFIFTTLSALYIGMALEKPHAEEHH